MPLNTGSISASRLLRQLRVLAPNPLKIRNRLLIAVPGLILVQCGRIRIPQSLTQRLISATNTKNSALFIELRFLQTLIQVRNIVSSLTASLRQVLLRLLRISLGASQLLLRSRNLLSPIGGGTRRPLLRLLQLASITGTPGPSVLGRLQPRPNSLEHALRTDRDSGDSASSSRSQRRNRGQQANNLSHRRNQRRKRHRGDSAQRAQNDPRARHKVHYLGTHLREPLGNPGQATAERSHPLRIECPTNRIPYMADRVPVHIKIKFNLVPVPQFITDPLQLCAQLDRRTRIEFHLQIQARTTPRKLGPQTIHHRLPSHRRKFFGLRTQRRSMSQLALTLHQVTNLRPTRLLSSGKTRLRISQIIRGLLRRQLQIKQRRRLRIRPRKRLTIPGLSNTSLIVSVNNLFRRLAHRLRELVNLRPRLRHRSPHMVKRVNLRKLVRNSLRHIAAHIAARLCGSLAAILIERPLNIPNHALRRRNNRNVGRANLKCHRTTNP